MVFVIIPVKTLLLAKQRLGLFLKPEERSLFCLAMLKDVLEATKESRGIEKVCIVSNDNTVLGLAKEKGIEGINEGEEKGLNSALELAMSICAEKGAFSVLILPLDIPLVKSEDISYIVDQADLEERLVTFTPSKDEIGTNALLMKPPAVIKPRFGPSSFAAHVKESKMNDIAFKICNLSRIALDIDVPEDLLLFFRQGKGTRAYDYLLKINFLERINTFFGVSEFTN